MSRGRAYRDSRNWRELYRAALFEPDGTNPPSRIEEARQTPIGRAQELFKSSPNYDGEPEAIANAFFVLQAL